MARVVLRRMETEAEDLPPVCARCGAQAADLTLVSLPYTPSSPGQKVAPELGHMAGHFHFAALFGFVLGLGVLFHGLWTGRRLSLWLPLCDQHQRTARWHDRRLRRGAVLLWSLAGGLTVAAVVAGVRLAGQGVDLGGFGSHWAYALLALACAAGALLIRARLHDGFLCPLRVTDAEVELDGVAGGFVRELARRRL